MPTTHLLLVPGCKWVGNTPSPPLCACTGMLWGDVLLQIFIIYLSYLLSFASNQLDDVSIKCGIYFWNSVSQKKSPENIKVSLWWNWGFLYFIYTFTYRTCRKFIMYQQLLLCVTWVSSLPFQLILHSLTVWWITTTVSLCNCISLVNQTLINF